MGAGAVLALAAAVIIAILVFVLSFPWWIAFIGMGLLGAAVAIIISVIIAYLAYVIIMRLYGAAKS